MLTNSKFLKIFYLKAENGLFIKTDDGQSYDTLAGKFVGLEKREHSVFQRKARKFGSEVKPCVQTYHKIQITRSITTFTTRKRPVHVNFA